MPSPIFTYYSGRNERIEALFQEHQRRFNRRQEIVAEEVLPAELLRSFTGSEADIRAMEDAKKREASRLLQLGDDRLRRLFFCRGGHSQLVLLACLLSDDPVFQKVLNNLHIESLESALFVLKEPHHLREKRRNGRFDENELNEGDPRFWYARGNVVSEFLDKLWQVAWAPIEQEAIRRPLRWVPLTFPAGALRLGCSSVCWFTAPIGAHAAKPPRSPTLSQDGTRCRSDAGALLA